MNINERAKKLEQLQKLAAELDMTVTGHQKQKRPRPLTVTISGEPKTGKTTVAALLAHQLKDWGVEVSVTDDGQVLEIVEMLKDKGFLGRRLAGIDSVYIITETVTREGVVID